MEYFHILCEKCDGGTVELDNLRMVGGVPQVEATCSSCGERGDFKLPVRTWMNVIPGMER